MFRITFAASLALTAAASAAPGAAARVSSPLVAHSNQGMVTNLSIDAAAMTAARGNDTMVMAGFALDPVRRVDLQLERFDVFSPDARIVVVSGGVETEIPRPDVTLYRGTVEGLPGSRVFLALSPDGTQGFIESAEGRFIVSTTPAGKTVIFDRDVVEIEAAEFICGVAEAEALRPRLEAMLDAADGSLPPRSLTPVGVGGCATQAQIAIETDHEYTEIFGSTAAASGYAAVLIGAISTIYQDNLSASLVISFIRLWADDNDPWTNPNAIGQLFDFLGEWNATMGDVDRDLAHFLSGRALASAGGVAFLPGLCTTAAGYGLSARINGFFPQPVEDNSHQNWDLVVVAHELGHNFNAPHTHSQTPPVDQCAFGDCSLAEFGTIMSYCHLCPGGLSNIALHFHPQTIEQHIAPYLAGDHPDCDLTASAPEFLTHPETQVGCLDQTVTFSVSVQAAGPMYQWRFNGFDIEGANGAALVLNNITVLDEGLYDVVVLDACGSEITSNAAALIVDVSKTCDPKNPGGCPTCTPDFNGDCNVGTADFLFLLGQWGQAGGPADLDNDGDVGTSDFLLLLGQWGPCPA